MGNGVKQWTNEKFRCELWDGRFDSVPDDSVVIPSKREGSEISRCARNDMRTQRISTHTFMSNILLCTGEF